MNNIIGHIVGLDELHKQNLITSLAKHIKIIDLDSFQQKVYNHTDISKLKMAWNQTSKDISVLRKQKKISGSKRKKLLATEKQIKKLMIKRNKIKDMIHSNWRKHMIDRINKSLHKSNTRHILFLGFNIFPKDYRQKIVLPVSPTHRFLIEMSNKKYSENQIKYYLNTYGEKIIKGTFPLRLLEKTYLESKYDKFITFYDKHGYKFSPLDKIRNEVISIDKELFQQMNRVKSEQKVTKSDTSITKSKSLLVELIPSKKLMSDISPGLKSLLKSESSSIKRDQSNTMFGGSSVDPTVTVHQVTIDKLLKTYRKII